MRRQPDDYMHSVYLVFTILSSTFSIRTLKSLVYLPPLTTSSPSLLLLVPLPCPSPWHHMQPQRDRPIKEHRGHLLALLQLTWLNGADTHIRDPHCYCRRAGIYGWHSIEIRHSLALAVSVMSCFDLGCTAKVNSAAHTNVLMLCRAKNENADKDHGSIGLRSHSWVQIQWSERKYYTSVSLQRGNLYDDFLG